MTFRQYQVLILAAGLALVGCGGTDPAGTPPASTNVVVAVEPSAASVGPRGNVGFFASVTGTVNTSVTWTVTEATGGTVDATGRYVAPAGTGTFHVVARSVADPSVSATAVVNVTSGPVVSVSLSPSSVALAASASVNFVASVTGASDTSVDWAIREASGCGSISASGAYTAPSTSATCHVVATSRADATATAMGTVTVTAVTSPPPGPPVALASCANEPMRTTGTTYYVCDCQAGASAGCVAGSDANTGTSPGAPWQSFSKAMTTFRSMPAGSTVALCRGGSWTGATTGGVIRNKNCRASGTCDLRDYAAPWNQGTAPKPILNGNGSSNLFELGWYRDYSQSVQGFRFLNLDIRKAGTAWTMWGGVTDVEMCNSDVTDSSAVQYVVTNSTTKRINMHHGVFTRVAQTGTLGQAYLGSCDDCVIDSNVFDYCGGSTNRFHPIYVGANAEPCTSGCNTPITGGSGTFSVTQRMRITNNRLTHSSQSGGACVGVVIVVHEPHDGLVIENNLISEPSGVANPGCWGISIGNGLDEPGYWKNVRIARNQLYNAGNNVISVENCQDCAIEDNLIVSAQTADAITAPYNVQSVGVGPNLQNTRTTVRNNTVYFTSTAGGGRGIVLGKEGTGYVVANNAIHFDSTSSRDGFTCLRLDLPPSSYAAVDNNLCYFPASSGGRWSSTSATLAGWQSATGFDTHSLQANPLFVNASGDPGTADFTPSATSPLVGAASATLASPTAIGSAPWSAEDGGKARGAVPDIGAYQR